VPTKRPDRAARLDLNLLRVLDALLDERSVTTAAGRVHVTSDGAQNSEIADRATLAYRDCVGCECDRALM
jgi:hypothetical protein